MRLVLPVCFTLFFCPCIYGEPSWNAQTEEEALCLRRIAEFWQEGEYQIVKEQIQDFLADHPESAFAQTLGATLGDLYLREKNFKDALMQYSRISDPEIADRVFLNRMQCLLELQWFATLADECEFVLQTKPLDTEKKTRVTYLLAFSLYQQCLNAPKDSELIVQLSLRALPYFQSLYENNHSTEIALGYAHLSSNLKQFTTAAEIYLKLAEDTEAGKEDLLFRAASCQTQYNKLLAIQTFQLIEGMNQSRSQDALYNRFILTFDSGQYEELLKQKDSLLRRFSPENRKTAHLLFGRSYLELKNYPDALAELLCFIQQAPPSPELHSALIDTLDTAFKLGDEAALRIALMRFSELYPDDPELSKGYFGHALLLKKNQRFEEARQAFALIRTQFEHSPYVEVALFEQIQLEFHEHRFSSCRVLCYDYLERFTSNEHSPFVWRFLASSAQRLAQDESSKKQSAADLQALLNQKHLDSSSERIEWSLAFAKMQYELKEHEQVIATLEPLIASSSDFPERANAYLLLALSYRDGRDNPARFCSLMETALELHATLLDEPSIHLALFNGYLSLSTESSLDLAADHLFIASQYRPIQADHLLWMADTYYTKFTRDPTNAALAEKAATAMEQFLAQTNLNIQALDPSSLFVESSLLKFAELQGALGNADRELALLESLQEQQVAHPDWPWQEENKLELLLAEQYAKRGEEEHALGLFDRIVAKHPTVRTFISASAALQGARLRLAKWAKEDHLPTEADLSKTRSQLKTLVLQKTLANEPIHLEAALEYVYLQQPLDIDKRLELFTKLKADFERQDDLLSRDYHTSRGVLMEKDRIYQSYMCFFEAEILLCRSSLASLDSEQNALLEQAKQLYRDILKTAAPPQLCERARLQLEKLSS